MICLKPSTNSIGAARCVVLITCVAIPDAETNGRMSSPRRINSTFASRTTWASCSWLKNGGRGTTVLPEATPMICAAAQSTPLAARIPILFTPAGNSRRSAPARDKSSSRVRLSASSLKTSFAPSVAARRRSAS